MIIDLFFEMGFAIQAFIIIVFIAILVYLIFRRLKEKDEENFEDRDY